MKAQKVKFPYLVKVGSSSVTIYRQTKPSGDYYILSYYLGGKRQRPTYANFEEAKIEAEAKAAQLARGDVDAVQLTGRDRLVYGRALDAISATGLALDAVAIDYAAAHKLLEGHSVTTAARFYMRHHGDGIKPKLVSEAVDEMIDDKRASGLSDVYLADLRYRLGSFSDRFKCKVHELAPDDVREFFNDLKLEARGFNNFLTTLRTFLAYSKNHGWISKDTDLLAAIGKRKQSKATVEIFTHEQIAALLKCASDDLRPCLAIAAFAGLRMEEIVRLSWDDVNRRPGFIEVEADKAKTQRRRLVPISNNLKSWLRCNSEQEGMLWPHSRPFYWEAIADTASRAKVTWKQNALRHSFISYRLAEIQKADQVALEAGNSPQMIFQNYRELVTPAQAVEWFAVCPTSKVKTKGKKIIKMKAAA